jgi:hypothetical protein
MIYRYIIHSLFNAFLHNFDRSNATLPPSLPPSLPTPFRGLIARPDEGQAHGDIADATLEHVQDHTREKGGGGREGGRGERAVCWVLFEREGGKEGGREDYLPLSWA